MLVVADGVRQWSGPDGKTGAHTAPRPAQVTAAPSPPTPGLFVSWARLDRRDGRIVGSANLAEPSDTMSMVKPWLAADYLHRADADGVEPGPERFDRLSAMIRDSDNDAAEEFFGRLGGPESITRMITRCGLTDSRPHWAPYWSNTTVSARDTVRLGACLADGRAAGQRWTPWLLSEMRAVRGTGDFGLRSVLPDSRAIAIKNGWLLRDEDGLWHVACLAVADDWVVGVLARYPAALGLSYGTELCRDTGWRALAARPEDPDADPGAPPEPA